MAKNRPQSGKTDSKRVEIEHIIEHSPKDTALPIPANRQVQHTVTAIK